MPDLYSIPDPFSRLDRLFAGPRRRAAYPPLSDAETDTQVSKLTDMGLTSLGYVGSTLDKLTGARAIRGVLGGHPGEALSFLPGSDVLGLTDPSQMVQGEDLYRAVTGRDPSQGNWFERNVVGPGVEIALDPSTYVGGIGALTKLGKAAAKTGTVTRGFLPAVRAGERSIHPLVGLAAKLTPGLASGAAHPLQLGAANAAELAGKGVGKVNVGLRKTVPGLARVEDLAGGAAEKAALVGRSLFDQPSGPSSEAVAQGEHRRMFPKRQEELRKIKEAELDLRRDLPPLEKRGVLEPAETQRYLRQLGEGVPPTHPEGRTASSVTPGVRELMGQLGENVKAEGVPGFIGPSYQPHLLEQLGLQVHPDVYAYGPSKADILRPFAERLRGFGATGPIGREEAAGLQTSLLSDKIQYMLRQRNRPGRGGGGLGGGSKLFGTSHPSVLRRTADWRGWYGGTQAIEDLMTPNLAGRARSWSNRQINEYVLADQLGRLKAATGGLPLSPEEFSGLQKRAVDMQRSLKGLQQENITGGTSGGILRRLGFLPRDVAATALARSGEVVPARVPFWEPDAIRAASLRAQRAAKVGTAADALFGVVGRAATHAVGAEGEVPVTEVLRRNRLLTDRGVDRAFEALGVTPAQRAAYLERKRLGGMPEPPPPPSRSLGLNAQPSPEDQVRRLMEEGLDPNDAVAQITDWLDPAAGRLPVEGVKGFLQEGRGDAAERLGDWLAPTGAMRPEDQLAHGLNPPAPPRRLGVRFPPPAAAAPFDERAALREMLSGYNIPEAQATSATRMLNRPQMPEMLRPLAELSDRFINAWKTGVYSAWPGSLVRNVIGGRQQALFMSGMSPISHRYGIAADVLANRPVPLGIPELRDLPLAEQRQAILRETYPRGIVGGVQGDIAERVGAQDVGKFGLQAHSDPLAARQGYRDLIKQIVPSVRQKGPRGLLDVGEIGRSAGTLAEDRMRLAQYMHLRAQGMLPDVAQEMVHRTHFDYGRLSDFEKTYLKRLIPFYTFSRFNIPKQLGQAVTRPLTIGGPIRFSGSMRGGDEQNYVPEYLRSGLALPLGEGGEGTRRYLSSLGLPLEDAFSRLKIGANPLQTIQRSGEGFLGMLRPDLRTGLELLTGRQFFTGRDLADLHVGKVENFLSGGNEALGQLISEGATAMPASRFVSTLNRLLDERKYTGGIPGTLATLGLPLASGARITDVDVEKWRAIDARKQLEARLQAAQHIRESRDYYADRKARAAGEVTPEEGEMLRTYAALKQRAREVNDRRRVGIQIGR